MLNNIVAIKIKDASDYNDEYTTFYVLKDKSFEDNYIKLKELCTHYDTFQDIEDFIIDNFLKLPVEERTIEI